LWCTDAKGKKEGYKNLLAMAAYDEKGRLYREESAESDRNSVANKEI
jgi:hypothetical protein